MYIMSRFTEPGKKLSKETLPYASPWIDLVSDCSKILQKTEDGAYAGRIGQTKDADYWESITLDISKFFDKRDKAYLNYFD